MELISLFIKDYGYSLAAIAFYFLVMYMVIQGFVTMDRSVAADFPKVD